MNNKIKQYMIPLEDIRININIYNHIAQVISICSYNNTYSFPIEINHSFEIPFNASIFDFYAKVENVVTETKLIVNGSSCANIKEFDGIKSLNNDPEDPNILLNKKYFGYSNDSLKCELSKNNNILNIKTSNVNSGNKLDIIIAYVIELKTEINSEQLRLDIPLPIKNKLNLFTPYSYSISGSVRMSEGIKCINSKTYKTKFTDIKKTSLQFEINDLYILQNIGNNINNGSSIINDANNDIILIIERKPPKSMCLIQKINTNDTREQSSPIQLMNNIYKHVTMINVIPQVPNNINIINDIIGDQSDEIKKINKINYMIIFDNSNLIQETNLEISKQCIKLLATSLQSKFNFGISYNINYELFNKNDTNQTSKALEYINSINTLNITKGNNLYLILENIYDSIFKNNKGVIFLITNGKYNGSFSNSLFKLIKENPDINIFPICVGSSGNNISLESRNLIQTISEISNGHAEFINDYTDQLVKKVNSQFLKSQDSFLININNKLIFDIEGDYKIIPNSIPLIHYTDINTFYILSGSSGNVINSVKYYQNFDEYSLTTYIPIYTINNNNYLIHRMAGISIINNLTLLMKSDIDYIKNELYKTEIIETSLNLGILSNYTSFVTNYPEKIKEELIIYNIDDYEQQVDNLLHLPKYHRLPSSKNSNSNSSINNAISKNQTQQLYQTSIIIYGLPSYVIVGNTLISKLPCQLPFSNKFKEYDLITIVNEGINDGIYEVWNKGSKDEKWVINKSN